MITKIKFAYFIIVSSIKTYTIPSRSFMCLFLFSCWHLTEICWVPTYFVFISVNILCDSFANHFFFRSLYSWAYGFVYVCLEVRVAGVHSFSYFSRNLPILCRFQVYLRFNIYIFYFKTLSCPLLGSPFLWMWHFCFYLPSLNFSSIFSISPFPYAFLLNSFITLLAH